MKKSLASAFCRPMRLCVLCASIGCLSLSTATIVLAEPTPIPATSPTPDISTRPAKFDPCGGPLELENKLGPTACVFPLGEAMIQSTYQSVNIPGSPQGAGSLGKGFKVPVYAHVVGYPAAVMSIGVTPRAEVDLTPPSFVRITSTNVGTIAAGALDTQLSYKQLLYVNLKTRMLAAVRLTYRAPTGSQSLRAIGPAYQLNPIIGHRFGPLLGLTLALPLNNAVVRSLPSAGVHRAWSLPPKLLAYWQTPGGTQLTITLQHSFSPDVTPVSLGVMQLLNRHVLVQVQYGGLNVDGPIAGLVRTTTSAYPRALFMNVYYLCGHSDRPTWKNIPTLSRQSTSQ